MTPADLDQWDKIAQTADLAASLGRPVGVEDAAAFAADIRAIIARQRQLEAERDALRTKVERMGEALKPFADWALAFDRVEAHASPTSVWANGEWFEEPSSGGTPGITYGDLRRARQAITAEKQEAEGGR